MDVTKDRAAGIPRRTLKSRIGCIGIGIHSGKRASLAFRPAGAGQGIVFRRTDLGRDIPALFGNVVGTRLCTELGDGAARVGTVEHVMAALAATGVTDVIVEVDGPEVPILDGSAASFVFLVDCAGLAALDGTVQPIRVTQPVRVGDSSAWAELTPVEDDALTMEMTVDFAAAAIGRQSLSLTLDEARFRRELARARTFALAPEVEALREAGFGLGGNLENVVVVDDDRVLNPGGLRYKDEFVRHKLLDAAGDLALAGAPLIGRFRGHCSGHALNNRLLHALVETGAAEGLAPPAVARAA